MSVTGVNLRLQVDTSGNNDADRVGAVAGFPTRTLSAPGDTLTLTFSLQAIQVAAYIKLADHYAFGLHHVPSGVIGHIPSSGSIPTIDAPSNRTSPLSIS